MVISQAMGMAAFWPGTALGALDGMSSIYLVCADPRFHKPTSVGGVVMEKARSVADRSFKDDVFVHPVVDRCRYC